MPDDVTTPATRKRVRLSGGPYDRCIIVTEASAFEAGMSDLAEGPFHIYEIKGVHGSYIGPRTKADADLGPPEW